MAAYKVTGRYAPFLIVGIGNLALAAILLGWAEDAKKYTGAMTAALRGYAYGVAFVVGLFGITTLLLCRNLSAMTKDEYTGRAFIAGVLGVPVWLAIAGCFLWLLSQCG